MYMTGRREPPWNLIIQGIEVDFPRTYDAVQNMPNREHYNHNH